MAPKRENPPTLASLRAGRVQPRSPERQANLLFSPSEPAEAPRTERRIWTVADLVATIRRQVETTHTDLWVEGEISNCRPAPSGHIYFTLKDANAQLPVALFRREASLLRFRPADGLAVLVRGRLSV